MLHWIFNQREPASPLAPILASSRRALRALAATSGVINVLTLTGSIFMMQVYDRVIGSNSLPTLYALGALAMVAYAFQGWLETLRARLLTLVAEKVDAELGPQVQAAGLKAAATTASGTQDGIQAHRDLESIRSFLSGPGLVAIFDMPWILLYFVVTTLLHPLFGLATLLASLLLIWLTFRTEVVSRPLLKEAIDHGIRRQQLNEAVIRNSEVVAGNGMFANMARRLADIQAKALAAQRHASFVIAKYSSSARAIRFVIQSFVLALGAFLALQGKITSGAIIGASILVARALAPIDQAIASWRPFVAAREAHARIIKLFGRAAPKKDVMPLPLPARTFELKDFAVATPGGQTVAVQGVSLEAKAGEAIAVIGQSAAGKSSLFRAIVGAWKLNRGGIEFDGTNPDQWSPDSLGRAIGYLPQNVQLFEGTIAENIARFDAEIDPEKVQQAARAAGLDGYIRKQFAERGYNTPLAPGAENLSGGQRQRIGLARALYGDPFLVVLDEPTSNLDQGGREALLEAIRSVKARNGIVLVAAHDPAVWAICDKALALHQGRPELFGACQEVLKAWHERRRQEAGGAPAGESGDSGRQPVRLATRPANGPAGQARPVAGPPRIAPASAAHGNTTGTSSWSTGTARLTPGAPPRPPARPAAGQVAPAGGNVEGKEPR